MIELKWRNSYEENDWEDVTVSTPITKAVETILNHPAVDAVVLNVDDGTAKYRIKRT